MTPAEAIGLVYSLFLVGLTAGILIGLALHRAPTDTEGDES